MESGLIWDESKRQANLQKHGLDFADANEVLVSRYRLDIEVMQGNEFRIQSISYALGFLAVLTVIHTRRDKAYVLSVFAVQVQKNGRLIVSGSKTNTMTRNEVLAAIQAINPEMDYVWDGNDEDDRPLTENELNMGIRLARSLGRPVGSDKTQIALRVDNSVLAAFKSTGKGWQSRMNDALKEWLEQHPAI